MKKKFIQLIERNSVEELRSYFDDLPAEKPLDSEDELIMLDHFNPEVVMSFTYRFRFSQKGEIRFIQVAPANVRRTYINYRGLWSTTQKYVIDNNLVEVARDFSEMRMFDDVDYLLEHGSPAMISDCMRYHVLENDDQVLALARHECTSLFRGYVSYGKYGRFVSDAVLTEIVNNELSSAFNAVVWQYGRNFKKRAKTQTYEQMKAKHLDNIAIPGVLQVAVLKSGNRWMIEPLLKTTPLVPEAQAVLFEMNFDAQWLKIHVVNMYCVGGYRFEPQYEELLFKALAKKNLDECLISFKLRNDDKVGGDVIFAENASPETLIKFIKEHWLSDAGQVAALKRGLGDVARVFISRFTPEHGMCGEAEVVLVTFYPVEVINLYTVFHSMCSEALSLLRQKSEEGISFYYQHHAY